MLVRFIGFFTAIWASIGILVGCIWVLWTLGWVYSLLVLLVMFTGLVSYGLSSSHDRFGDCDFGIKK